MEREKLAQNTNLIYNKWQKDKENEKKKNKKGFYVKSRKTVFK